jgi:hypothetical protein
VTTSSLPSATVGSAYSATLTAANASGPGTWSVSSGSLPAGLSLNPTTGVISGTPTQNGSNGFVVTYSEPGPPAQTATASLSITVAAAPAATPTPVGTTTTIYVQSPTPVTTPASTAAAKPMAKLVKVTSKGTKVSVTIGCSGADCTGALALTTVEHLSGTKITAVTARASAAAKSKAKTKTVTLAKVRYSVSAGRSKTVTLTLKGAAAKLLAARKSLSAKVALTPTGSKRVTAGKAVTLKAAAAAKSKKK